ncbi:phosphoesterase PA-phosphatase related protein [Dehalogenimonas lykanthroporepellens BL-DC-9]|nr:phosphoesterase PA-phosphatase related protein [Dehalogenimonas lykanthroporepellens BL-DC-9]
MEVLIELDQELALLINSWSGHIPILDELFRGLANDYFLVIGATLGILFLWLSSAEPGRRAINQRLSLQAMVSLGIASGIVGILNQVIYRARPFDELPINVLLYQPTDSSFPANSAAVLFAVAAATMLGNRKAGWFFLAAACLHSMARIYAGMYYPLDIVGGAAIAFLAALAVRWLFHLAGFFIDWLLGLMRRIFLAD